MKLDHRTIITITLLAGLALPQLGLAQPPQTISYQGVLRDVGTKKTVADDNYDLTFRLYDASTDGIYWWSETHAGVPVTDGIFNVILGSITSFISTDPKTKFEIPYWLEITVNDEPPFDRIQLTAVPYSIAARSVQGYRNVFPSNGNVGIGTTTPGAKLHIASPDIDGILLSDLISDSTRASLINWETYGGQLNLMDKDGLTQAVIRGYASPITGAQATFTAGSVGIGTTAPSAELEVVGAVKANSLTLPATMRYYSIPAAEFEGAPSSLGTTPYVTDKGTGSRDIDIYAPVHLPQGAIITEFSARVYDINATEDITVSLSYVSGFDDTYTNILTMTGTTQGGDVSFESTTLDHTVDNVNYSYVIGASWTSPMSPYNEDIKFRNALIGYTVTNPLP